MGDDLTTSTDSVALGLDGVFQKPLDAATLSGVLKTRLMAAGRSSEPR
jgi:hypothetical protein